MTTEPRVLDEAEVITEGEVETAENNGRSATPTETSVEVSPTETETVTPAPEKEKKIRKRKPRSRSKQKPSGKKKATKPKAKPRGRGKNQKSNLAVRLPRSKTTLRKNSPTIVEVVPHQIKVNLEGTRMEMVLGKEVLDYFHHGNQLHEQLNGKITLLKEKMGEFGALIPKTKKIKRVLYGYVAGLALIALEVIYLAMKH